MLGKMERSEQVLKVGLIGNPNSGKSTVFNQLTGLRQKTGNFPGVTVEVKEGRFTLPKGQAVSLIDFPGAYSLYPTSTDEKVLVEVLANTSDPNFPDLLVFVADVTHLEKHLLLFTQVLDLNIPTILALNMSDVAEAEGIKVNPTRLSTQLQAPVVFISGRTGENLPQLIQAIEQLAESRDPWKSSFYKMNNDELRISEAVCQNFACLFLVHVEGDSCSRCCEF